RYRFVPPGEVWVDGATSVEEFEYALKHEIHERQLMQTQGLSYDNAHQAALMLELGLRRKMRLACKDHELKQPYMPATDARGTQEEDAWSRGDNAQRRQRRGDELQALRKEAQTAPVEAGTRERGVRSTRNNLKA